MHEPDSLRNLGVGKAFTAEVDADVGNELAAANASMMEERIPKVPKLEPADKEASQLSKPARSECSLQKDTASGSKRGSSDHSPSGSSASKDLEKPCASEYRAFLSQEPEKFGFGNQSK